MDKRSKTEQRDRGPSDTLTALIRAGARKLVAQTLEAVVLKLEFQLR